MTEAGKRWVAEKANEEGLPDPVEWHALSRRAAEFWIRAFVAEVEKRAAGLGSGDHCFAQAFTALTRELIEYNASSCCPKCGGSEEPSEDVPIVFDLDKAEAIGKKLLSESQVVSGPAPSARRRANGK